MKLLSIIVPVYNKSLYMDSCIQSVLDQTVTNFELILVNDGSTDDSGKKCDAFQKKDSRIKVIHQTNQGVSAARNAGLAVAVGDYIGFVDSDDLLHPKMYETLITNIEKFNADLSICGVRRVSPDKTINWGGKNKITIHNKEEGLSALFNGEILLSNYDKLFRRELISNISFRPALFEDTFFNFEALVAANVTIIDDTILYDYMIRDNSHSLAAFNQKYMNAIELSEEIISYCKKHFPKHVKEAESFHFNTLMMILNMILIESRKKNKESFDIIRKGLKNLNNLYLKSNIVYKRYKYGYSLFQISPLLYSNALYLYSWLTNSEHFIRKSKIG